MTQYLLSVHSVDGEVRDPMTDEERQQSWKQIQGHCCIWPDGAVGGQQSGAASRSDSCQKCSKQSILASAMAFRDAGGGRRFEWSPDATVPPRPGAVAAWLLGR